MKRRAFQLAASLSLLLCIATSLLWARSYNTAFWLIREDFDASSGATEFARIHLATGRVTIDDTRYHLPEELHSLPSGRRWEFYRNPNWFNERRYSPPTWTLWNFDRGKFPYRGPQGIGTYTIVGVNLLLPAFITFFSPILCFIQYLLNKRRRLGLCPTCHYDLTGNLSGTCPECGTPIAPVP